MKINLKKYLITTFILNIFTLNIYGSNISNIENGQEDLYTQKEIIDIKEISEQEIIPNKTQTNETQNNITEKDLKINNIIKNSNIYDIYNSLPTSDETTVDAHNFTSKNFKTIFQNGDVYRISRINFKNDKKERFEMSIPI